MTKENLNLAELKEELQLTTEEPNFLFLDVSSTCTGYSIAKIDFKTMRAEILKAGAIWLNPNWSHQEKYYYLQKALEIVIQLRGHAGKRQVPNLQTGVAQSWRGIPSGSGAVAVFGRD